METNYLFQNCKSLAGKHTGGGLPFWEVFMNQRKDLKTSNKTDNITDLRSSELNFGCLSEMSTENVHLEGDRTIKRRYFDGSDEAGSSNSLGQKEFNLKMVKEFRISDGNAGFGYDKIFGDGIDERLKTVTVDEPYMRNKFQVINFIAFCELLVSRAKNLREIVLCTQTEQTALQELWTLLGQLRIDLMLRDVALKVKRSGTMHDREIRFDNGWTYRIGRGLDYFQKQQLLTLGMTDFNLRKCQETVVCILREV